MLVEGGVISPLFQVLLAQRGRSVAESVKALQNQGHMPCSPKTLRRAHSMAASHAYQTAANGAVRTNSISGPEQLRQEIIYAPVAELQQKINQRHHPGPGPSGGSPEGEQYGFGVQFQHQQNQFFNHHHHVMPDQR